MEFIKKEGRPGPPLEVKLSPEEVAGLARPHGLAPAGTVDLNEFMYLALFRTEA